MAWSKRVSQVRAPSGHNGMQHVGYSAPDEPAPASLLLSLGPHPPDGSYNSNEHVYYRYKLAKFPIHGYLFFFAANLARGVKPHLTGTWLDI